MDGTPLFFTPTHRSHICKPNIIVNIHCLVTSYTCDPISLPPRGILCLFLAFPSYLLPEIEIFLMDFCSGSKTRGLQFSVYANKTQRMTDSSSSSHPCKEASLFSDLRRHTIHAHAMMPRSGGGTDIGQSIIVKTNAIEIKQEQQKELSDLA